MEYEIDWSKGSPESYAFIKRRGFRREQELRAFIPYEYEWEGNKVIEPTYAGRSVPVQLRSLMAEVWLAPNSPDWFERVVRAELEKYGYGETPVRQRS